MPRRLSRDGAVLAYCGSLAATAIWILDEHLDLRRWKKVSYRLADPRPGAPPIQMQLAARTRPPPIGCAEWPAGRVALECAVEDGVLQHGNTVLEIGSGIGVAAIGLALLGTAVASDIRVVASDVCQESLDNLCANARASGVDVARVEGGGRCPRFAGMLPSRGRWMLCRCR